MLHAGMTSGRCSEEPRQQGNAACKPITLEPEQAGKMFA
jgi:hypothetical protein